MNQTNFRVASPPSTASDAVWLAYYALMARVISLAEESRGAQAPPPVVVTPSASGPTKSAKRAERRRKLRASQPDQVLNGQPSTVPVVSARKALTQARAELTLARAEKLRQKTVADKKQEAVSTARGEASASRLRCSALRLCYPCRQGYTDHCAGSDGSEGDFMSPPRTPDAPSSTASSPAQGAARSVLAPSPADVPSPRSYSSVASSPRGECEFCGYTHSSEFRCTPHRAARALLEATQAPVSQQ